jgi:hypothetical protein
MGSFYLHHHSSIPTYRILCHHAWERNTKCAFVFPPSSSLREMPCMCLYFRPHRHPEKCRVCLSFHLHPHWETCSPIMSSMPNMPYMPYMPYLPYRVEKKFCDILYFAYISTWENDKILVFVLKDTAWKAVQKMHKEIFVHWFKRFSHSHYWQPIWYYDFPAH